MKQEVSRDWSDDFPILREMVFFNHAGVAPISGRAASAVRKYADQANSRAYVGSGWYVTVRQVKSLAARLLGARGPQEIAFVPNTSTGISLVAKGLDWRPGDNVVISNVEFPANRYPWEDLRRLGVELIEVEQHPDGRIDVDDVTDAITASTRVVALSHVQYATGYRMDLRPIADMVHRAGGYLCVDAIQSVGAVPVNVEELGIDFLSADGHKWLLSPEGCGIFYCREELIPLLHPGVVGWMNVVNASDYGSYNFQLQADARRFEPGSYNVAGILGLGASLEMFLDAGIENVWSRIEALTGRLCDRLADKGYPVLSPRREGERSGIVTFGLPERLLTQPANAPVSPGSDPNAKQADPRLTKIVADLEKQGIVIVVREGRLRVSPHFYNTVEQIDRLVAAPALSSAECEMRSAE